MDAAHMVLSGLWLQEVDTLSTGSNKLLMLFIGIVAFSMLVQAIVLIVVAMGAAQTRKKMLEFAEEFRTRAFPVLEKVAPMIDGVGALVRDASPKIKVITENLVETSHMVRNKARDLDTTLTEANAKTRAQVTRVDGMVTSVLNTTADITASIQRGIKVPVREISGLVNGLKAGLDVLMGRAKGFGGAANARVYTPVQGSEFRASEYGAAEPAPRKDANVN